MLDPTLTAYGPWGIALAVAIAFLTQWLRNRAASAPATPAAPQPATPAQPAAPVTPAPDLSLLERIAAFLARLEQRFAGETPPKP